MGIKLSNRISAGVDDCPYVSTFYCYDPYLIVKLQIFPYTCVYVTGSAKTKHNSAIQIFQYKALKYIG